ncbi:hypothetical protein GCM10009753_19140 [Streptantibioticus ferralitis]
MEREVIEAYHVDAWGPLGSWSVTDPAQPLSDLHCRVEGHTELEGPNANVWTNLNIHGLLRLPPVADWLQGSP